MDILIWVILSYGLMNIVVYGSIFRNFRDSIRAKSKNEESSFKGFYTFVDGVINCPLCFSTWGGFFLGMFFYSPTYYYLDFPILISWFFDGIFSAGAVWALNSIIEWFEEK